VQVGDDLSHLSVLAAAGAFKVMRELVPRLLCVDDRGGALWEWRWVDASWCAVSCAPPFASTGRNLSPQGRAFWIFTLR
jgi:hypothetical protein